MSGFRPKLTRPSEVRALLTQLDFRPSRVLGQNFLIDRNILDILLNAAELDAHDFVLEVGPGLGVLTEELIERCRAVVAIEKDNRLAPYVADLFSGAANFTLIHSDVMDVDLNDVFTAADGKLAANLPYAIAARLLVELVYVRFPPAKMVVTIQREVADRIAAAPGTPDYGTLSILLQRHYAPKIIKHISPSCFFPPPEVQSSIILLERRGAPLGGAADEKQLNQLVKSAFQQRRKTLSRALRDYAPDMAAVLEAAGIAPTARAETVPPELWAALCRALDNADTCR